MRNLYTRVLPMTLALLGAAAQAQINLGTIGDSLTDEYLPADEGNQFYTDLAAHSWLEILAAKRPAEVDLGTYRAPPTLWDEGILMNGGLWDDSRDYGYERNFAKVGAAASRTSKSKAEVGGTIYNLGLMGNIFGMRSSYGDVMAAGLASKITLGEVDTVFIALGANDFFYQTRQFDADRNDYPRPDVDTSDPVWQDTVAADVSGAILAALDTIMSAGSTNIVIARIPMGTAASASTGDDPGTLAAIAKANDLLVTGVLERGILAEAIVDLFGFNDDPSLVNENGDVTIGGWVIPAGSAASAADLAADGPGPCNSTALCATESHAGNYAAEDGLHPNTIIQGLIANQVIDVLNTAYGAGIARLTDSEILGMAGVDIILPPGC